MKALKKIHLRNVSDFLSDGEMRGVVGGNEFDQPCHCPGVGDCIGYCGPYIYEFDYGQYGKSYYYYYYYCKNVNGDCKCV